MFFFSAFYYYLNFRDLFKLPSLCLGLGPIDPARRRFCFDSNCASRSDLALGVGGAYAWDALKVVSSVEAFYIYNYI